MQIAIHTSTLFGHWSTIQSIGYDWFTQFRGRGKFSEGRPKTNIDDALQKMITKIFMWAFSCEDTFQSLDSPSLKNGSCALLQKFIRTRNIYFLYFSNDTKWTKKQFTSLTPSMTCHRMTSCWSLSKQKISGEQFMMLEMIVETF